MFVMLAECGRRVVDAARGYATPDASFVPRVGPRRHFSLQISATWSFTRKAAPMFLAPPRPFPDTSSGRTGDVSLGSEATRQTTPDKILLPLQSFALPDRCVTSTRGISTIRIRLYASSSRASHARYRTPGLRAPWTGPLPRGSSELPSACS